MSNDFEIAVIGGGIHGVGIAQTAAAAGYKVALIEKSRWGAGTSSKSSKLIHGGLRYLETGQIPLVFHSLQERKLLLQIAPSLVKPVPFVIPIYKNTSRKPWQIRAGLSLYGILSGFNQYSRFQSLPKQRWDMFENLKTDNLQAVFRYWDAQTDDRLLTEAVAHSAIQLGVQIYCPAELISGKKSNEAYELQLQEENSLHTLSTQLLINASGPWVNDIIARFNPPPKKLDVDLVQGAHIVLNQSHARRVFYFESPIDKRAVFSMPWYGKTMLGTTETLHKGSPDSAAATPQEIDYLLTTGRHYLKHLPDTVSEVFAGLRVLPKTNSSLFNRPRESILHPEGNNERFISVYGGKLTSFRTTAHQMLKRCEQVLGKRTSIADTHNIELTLPKN